MTSDDDAALQKSAAVPMPTARLRFFALAFAALIAVTVAASWAWAKGRINRAEEALHTELERLRSDERANAEQASTRLQQTAKQRIRDLERETESERTALGHVHTNLRRSIKRIEDLNQRWQGGVVVGLQGQAAGTPRLK